MSDTRNAVVLVGVVALGVALGHGLIEVSKGAYRRVATTSSTVDRLQKLEEILLKRAQQEQ